MLKYTLLTEFSVITLFDKKMYYVVVCSIQYDYVYLKVMRVLSFKEIQVKTAKSLVIDFDILSFYVKAVGNKVIERTN